MHLIRTSDLLPRKERALDWRPVSDWLRGKRVAVTGVGFIGSELARQLSDMPLAELMLIDNNEFNLYQTGRQCSHARQKFGDVRDGRRMRELLYHMDVVFHAAAMKHVPICEQNVKECNETNITGTANVIMAMNPSSHLVFISTDKACNPTSAMGKAKRAAEMLARQAEGSIVRFGNVIGSSGSVVPLFQEQIAAGGPVTVTDSRMMRYFMTVGEAAELILQAGAMGTGTFVLDMGTPVSIRVLAEEMIRLSGRRDIEIVETGIRAGEKLHEELSSEALQETAVEGLMRVVE